MQRIQFRSKWIIYCSFIEMNKQNKDNNDRINVPSNLHQKKKCCTQNMPSKTKIKLLILFFNFPVLLCIIKAIKKHMIVLYEVAFLISLEFNILFIRTSNYTLLFDCYDANLHTVIFFFFWGYIFAHGLNILCTYHKTLESTLNRMCTVLL